jgi:gluconokinase
VIVVVSGVAGSGKTTIGSELAAQLGWQFFDGDDFHSAANKKKMARGVALTDDDRRGWLGALRGLIAERNRAGLNAVLACSALKESYRKTLSVDPALVKFVFLKGSAELIKGRLHSRKGHFFDERLLGDQLATLEEPAEAITVEIADTPRKIVATLRSRLALSL